MELNDAQLITVNRRDLLVLPAELTDEPGYGLPDEVLHEAGIEPSEATRAQVVGSLPGFGRVEVIDALVEADPTAGVKAVLTENDLALSTTAGLLAGTGPAELIAAMVEADLVDTSGGIDGTQIDANERLAVAVTLDPQLTAAMITGDGVETVADDLTSQIVQQLVGGLEQDQAAQLLEQLTP